MQIYCMCKLVEGPIDIPPDEESGRFHPLSHLVQVVIALKVLAVVKCLVPLEHGWPVVAVKVSQSVPVSRLIRDLTAPGVALVVAKAMDAVRTRVLTRSG